MFDKTEVMFDKFRVRMGKVRKKEYANAFDSFLDENRELLEEMLTYISSAEDNVAAADEVAKTLFDNLSKQYGKRGKMPGTLHIDLSMYMIYYLFPAIMKIDNENSQLFADAVRDEWRVRSKNPQFSYTTFEEVQKGFKEKIFGVF